MRPLAVLILVLVFGAGAAPASTQDQLPSENQPYAFMKNLRATEAFDVMLFVDKTTSAVANPPGK